MPVDISLNSATQLQLQRYCDENGLDYSNATGPGSRAKVMAIVRQSGLVPGDHFTIEEDPEAKIATARPQARRAVDQDPGERLPPALLTAISDAMWPLGTPAYEERKGLTAEQINAACIEYRNAQRIDPRNPFPGKAHGDRVSIMIHAQDPEHFPGGDQPVYISVNDRSFSVARGEWVDLPWEHACALAKARTTITRSDPTHGMVRTGEVPSYPFQVMAA